MEVTEESIYLCNGIKIVMSTKLMTSLDVYSLLLARGIKPSHQRIALLEYLVKHPVHPTVDDLYSKLSPKMPTLSKTTVYNTLKLFVEKGAARMLTIDERNACFDADMHPHAHFFCKRCGRIFDAPLPGAGASIEHIPHELEHCDVEEVQLYYRGVCADCLEQQS